MKQLLSGGRGADPQVRDRLQPAPCSARRRQVSGGHRCLWQRQV
jgi:hypothetical protein